ncbi:hypothetical protein CFU_0675 [Collimonas fungivorans Ter331]|uniref:Uncharacterized protein n=1 Tax=Collimonas fungivorans (strain Ter331) TaxID=1005048 RepID=G0AEY3_COLFT|nr:hypothetical protein CFU_0675 [Collimonas fungivorans Ter331]
MTCLGDLICNRFSIFPNFDFQLFKLIIRFFNFCG